MPTWELVITGCGVSHGNPPWGYPDQWSDDPRDHRRRAGALLRGPDGQVLLIDTGPDLMHQMRDPYRTWDGLHYPVDCITRCDGVLLTHDHADHTHGLNDLRHFNRLMDGRQIPIYGNAGHLDEIRRMFPYCFGGAKESYHQGLPGLITQPLIDDHCTIIAGLPVTPFAMSHGPAGRTTGFRLGPVAYLTDVKVLPPEAERHLQNLDILFLDMLREAPHPTHFCWAEAEALIARLRPRRTVLIHLGHEMRHAAWDDRLPAGVELAVDGMRRTFTIDAPTDSPH